MRNIHVLLMLPFLIMAACKKDKKVLAQGCFIREARETTISHTLPTKRVHVFEYNDDGTVAKIATTTLDNPGNTLIRMFSYSGKMVFIDHFMGSSGKSATRMTMALDDQKRIRIGYIMNTGGLGDTLTVAYDGEGQAAVMNFGSVTTNLSWAKGDVISKDNQESFSYYDTAYNVGAIKASFNELLEYGIPIIKRTGLRKASWAPSSDTLFSTYQLDGDGKILKWTEASKNDSYSHTLEYTYECR